MDPPECRFRSLSIGEQRASFACDRAQKLFRRILKHSHTILRQLFRHASERNVEACQFVEHAPRVIKIGFAFRPHLINANG